MLIIHQALGVIMKRPEYYSQILTFSQAILIDELADLCYKAVRDLDYGAKINKGADGYNLSFFEVPLYIWLLDPKSHRGFRSNRKTTRSVELHTQGSALQKSQAEKIVKGVAAIVIAIVEYR